MRDLRMPTVGELRSWRSPSACGSDLFVVTRIQDYRPPSPQMIEILQDGKLVMERCQWIVMNSTVV